MSEPIYRAASGWIWHEASNQSRCLVQNHSSRAQSERAAHLLKLLNADRFPEDRPKRFVANGTSTSTVLWVVDTRTGRCLGDWPIAYYPDHRERAEAEAARLNAEYREEQ